MNKEQLKDKMMGYSAPKEDDKENYLGVEIEFSCPVPENEVMDRLIEANLAQYISIGYDGRPPEGHIGYEWRVLVKQSEAKTVLPAIGKVIASMGGMSNDSCGLHVHLDMRHRNPNKVYNNLVRTQSILFGVADKRRSTSAWCRKQTSAELSAASRGKNAAINPHLAPMKNTIEVRIREGIVDGDDMFRWVRLLVSIADCKYLGANVDNVSDLENNVKLSRYVRDYVKFRIKNNKRSDLLGAA